MPSARRLLRLSCVVASAYYALWACAPAATMRPMTLDLDTPDEFGIGAAATFPTDPTAACTNELFSCEGGFNGQLWYQHRFDERFSFGGTLFAGQTSIVGGGVIARFHWVEIDRLRFGTDLEAGFLWGAVGLPLSVRLVDDLWVYTNPSVGLRFVQPARFPLGVAWGVTDNVWLTAEGAWGFDFLSSPTRSGIYDNHWTAALGGSYRF